MTNNLFLAAKILQTIQTTKYIRKKMLIPLQLTSRRKAFDETNEEFAGTPEYTEADMQKAKESGKVTVYSSYPIAGEVFVTPFRMEAQG